MVLSWGPTGLSKVMAKAHLSDARELDQNQKVRFFRLPLTNLRGMSSEGAIEGRVTYVDANELVLVHDVKVCSALIDEIAFIFDRE